MKRRAFLKSMGLGILMPWLGPFGHSTPVEEKQEIYLQSSQIAGLRYYGADRVWDSLKEGSPLSLQAEPENSHDPLAVEISSGRTKLGYVPRYENALISTVLQKNVEVVGRVISLERAETGWQRVRFEAYMKVKV